MKEYNPHEIEPRWQDAWEAVGQDKVKEDPAKEKKYVLEMFPYPSGDIHMGHVSNYTYGDVAARFARMQGFDVLHPMGWDAFGLPAENAAIKHKSHPAKWTYANIATQQASFKRMGFSYDWDRKVVACDPEYYRWGQWIFLKFWERGLVERRNSPVNWCPDCATVLANEQVIDGCCWRCHSEVEKRDLTQWYFKITDYAQELLDDLDQLTGWPENVKAQQRNWIGRSEGAEIDFALAAEDGVTPTDRLITVFTTRADTLYGTTFFLLPPESALAAELVAGTEYELRLENFRDTTVKARVVSFTRMGGELAIRLSVQSSVLPVLYIRSCTGVLGDDVTSLMVPERAIYIQDNMPGIVRVYDNDYAQFIPINVQEKRDGMCYITPIQPGSVDVNDVVMLFN